MTKQSILIIDDSKLINNSLSAALLERGFEVTQAFNLAEAKAILLDNRFDYALLDLILPDGDGELLLPYLQIHEEIRVIVMTSDRDRDRRENLFNFGVVIDYITKERHFDDLELSIVQLIERISTNDTLTILVVDDSSFMRTHLRILLSKRGFKVLDAIDGKVALEIIKSHKVDAAMIDLEMPVMDGNRLLSAIRRHKANLLMPIMVISGTSDPEKVARVIKNGAYDFMKKPYATEELLLKVDKMMQDVKQQRLIKKHEARFALYNRAIDQAAIFIKLDKDLKILYANKVLNKGLAKGVEISAGTHFEDYINSETAPRLKALQEAMRENRSFQEVFTLKRKKYNNLSLRLTFSPIKDSSETITEIIAIGFDVTLLQNKEAVLQERIDVESKKNWEQNKLLIQQSKMAAMGEMIGHIGHQWRQPLNSLGLIIQKINIAYQHKKLDESLMNRSVEKGMSLIDQMSKTIDDFKNFFSEDKSWRSVYLMDILNQVRDIIEPTLEAKNIRLSIHCDSDTLFPCLKNELSQVLLNIIANAMDAIIEREISNGEISISIESTADDAVMIIDDNAGGIPDEIISRVFEPYFTTKEQNNGTGIGLYMSKTIIEEHMNGTLQVYNTLLGASFKLSLPINSQES